MVRLVAILDEPHRAPGSTASELDRPGLVAGGSARRARSLTHAGRTTAMPTTRCAVLALISFLLVFAGLLVHCAAIRYLAEATTTAPVTRPAEPGLLVPV